MSRFFCDSNCELNYKLVEKYNINVIGMPYTLDDVEGVYDMGKTDFTYFFEDIKKGKIAKTQALNPSNYIDYFEPVLSAGEDILYVHFSRELSGTFNQMEKAIDELKDKYPNNKITIIDTKNISMGAGLVVLEAAKAHSEGKTDEEIVELVKYYREKVYIYFMVDDLGHLKRGGRVSPTTAFIGGLLNIKPMLIVDKSGKLNKITTVKGQKKAVEYFLNKLETERDENTFNHKIIILTSEKNENTNNLILTIKEKYSNSVVENYQIGPTVGAHCGPGTIGFIFIGK